MFEVSLLSKFRHLEENIRQNNAAVYQSIAMAAAMRSIVCPVSEIICRISPMIRKNTLKRRAIAVPSLYLLRKLIIDWTQEIGYNSRPA